MADDANPSTWTTTRAASRPTIRKVEAVVNPLSGSVGPGAAEALEALLSEHGVAMRVCEATARDLPASVRAAVDAAPDLVVILAGDGTAAMAARRAGPDGPMVAPLPGGTMNMLPHAVYGPVAWREALSSALTNGEARPVSGGEVDGNAFYVAAVLGAPALWARAREAMRKGRLDLAIARARTALGRAFTGALNYRLQSGPEGKCEALSFLCPLTSRRMQPMRSALTQTPSVALPLGSGLRQGVDDDLGPATQRFRLAVHSLCPGLPDRLDIEHRRRQTVGGQGTGDMRGAAP